MCHLFMQVCCVGKKPPTAPETMSRTRTDCGRAEARPYNKKPTLESPLPGSFVV